MADVDILIGAKGGDKLDGESGLEIRRNLSNQLANGIKIKVGFADGVASQLQAELDKIGQGLTLKVKNVQMPAGTQNSGGSSSASSSGGSPRLAAVSKTAVQSAGMDFDAAIQRASELKTKTQEITKAVAELTTAWNQFQYHRTDANVGDYKKAYTEQLNLVKKLLTAQEQLERSQAPSTTTKQWDALAVKEQKAIEAAQQYKIVSSQIEAQLQNVINARAQADSARATSNGDTEYQNLVNQISALDQLVKKERQRRAEVTQTSAATSQAVSMQASFNEYVNNLNPKAWKEFGTQIEHIQSLLGQAQTATGEVAKRIQKDASDAIRKFKGEMKAAGYEGGNAFTYLEGKIKAFTTYFAAARLSTGLISSITKAKDTVVDLNKAMTDLQIVTGDNDEQAKKLMQTYNGLAQELGSTTASVASGAQDWLRQGYSLNETNELLKDSMSLSIMGNMDAEEATTSLTAALKGYQLQVDQASSVVDKFFAVDMAAATSSSKLATALSKCAANAKLAGLSLNDVIGQLAVVNETMQEAGESTGTFYNTMLARMGNIKAGRLSDPETGEDLSDVETTLKGAGIRLRDSESEFRNFGDVLDEVAGKWNSFSDVTQRAIASAFAGSRQQTRFLALMQGYPQAAKYAETAANSIGVSAQKMEVYQDSVGAKANRMTAAFEKFSSVVISDDLVGFFYDLGAGALNTASSFDGLLVKIPLLIAAFAAVKASLAGIKKTEFGQAFIGTFKDLAGPKMTGSMRNHVAIISKAAA